MGNERLLLTLTTQLWEYMDEISVKFEEVKKTKEKGDFFLEVKPFADQVKTANDQWKQEAAIWIKENRPKHLHEKQIESASEQIEMLSVQAFFPETSRSRFINYWQSVRFILSTLLDYLKDE
jgi:hypothetical protein